MGEQGAHDPAALPRNLHLRHTRFASRWNADGASSIVVTGATVSEAVAEEPVTFGQTPAGTDVGFERARGVNGLSSSSPGWTMP